MLNKVKSKDQVPSSQPMDAMGVSPFVEVSRLTFSYGVSDRKVLNDLSFEVPRRSTLAVVGGSGTGKSTLLKLLGGLLSNVRANDLSGTMVIKGTSPEAYRRSGKLSFIFQDPTLLDHQTVIQNIALPLKARNEELDHAQDLEHVLQVVGLSDSASLLPRELSGGMKTRVSLARAFVGRPELLLLDEPFSALDIAWRSRLYGYFMELRDQFQTTSLLVTHDIEEAVILADRILMLDHEGRGGYLVDVVSPYSGLDRLKYLSSHLKAVYDDVTAPIRQCMMVDGRRRMAAQETEDSVIARLMAGDELAYWELRPFSGKSKRMHDFLVGQLQAAPSLTGKYKVVWDVLNYENPEEKVVLEVRNLYFEHLDLFSKLSLRFYASTPERYLDHIMMARFSGTDIPKHKLWIYYFDLIASSERSRVSQFVKEAKAKASGVDPFLFDSLEMLETKLTGHA